MRRNHSMVYPRAIMSALLSSCALQCSAVHRLFQMIGNESQNVTKESKRQLSRVLPHFRDAQPPNHFLMIAAVWIDGRALPKSQKASSTEFFRTSGIRSPRITQGAKAIAAIAKRIADRDVLDMLSSAALMATCHPDTVIQGGYPAL